MQQVNRELINKLDSHTKLLTELTDFNDFFLGQQCRNSIVCSNCCSVCCCFESNECTRAFNIYVHGAIMCWQQLKVNSFSFPTLSLSIE